MNQTFRVANRASIVIASQTIPYTTADGARPSASLDDKAAKVDHKRVSVRVVDEEDDMDIDWESIIEQRKTSKAGEVKQEPTDTTEDDKTTALANVSHAVTAAQGPGELLEAHEDKEV